MSVSNNEWPLMKGAPKIGERLKSLRREAGVSAYTMAKAVGLASAQTLYGYENNRREPPYEMLLRLCEYFGVTPSDVFSYPPTNRLLMRDVVKAVDQFLELRSCVLSSEKRADLYFAVYDALCDRGDITRTEDGDLDLNTLSGLIRLTVQDAD